MNFPEPNEFHRWLEQLVGEWTYDAEALMGPDQPPTQFQGTESVRSIGGLWVLCESTTPTPDGSPACNILTLGFDPANERFVGTFISSMMTNLWIYDGQLAVNTLTLDAEGPSFTGDGKLAKYQDIAEILDADRRTFSSQILGEDGKWVRFMTMRYTRKR